MWTVTHRNAASFNFDRRTQDWAQPAPVDLAGFRWPTLDQIETRSTAGLSPAAADFIRRQALPPSPEVDDWTTMNSSMLLWLLIEQLLAAHQQSNAHDRALGGGGSFSNVSRGNTAGWGTRSAGAPSRSGAGASRASSSGPTQNTTAAPPRIPLTNNQKLDTFVQKALAQNGDRYVYGAETRLDDADPNTFDCSELVQWAGAQAGVEIPDGSSNQRAWVRRHGTEISVEEALKTPGALLFKDGHVAISLGDGRTIEAKGSKYGVGVFNGKGRFTSGGLIPGMHTA